MAAISASSLLAVTIALIVLIICGEIQSSAGETRQHDELSRGELAAPRTFGRIRMLKNFMLPMIFLLGGIKTLLLMLLAISLKTLFVGMTILVINISVGLAKIINFFKNGSHHGGGGGGYGGWASPEKTVNIHIHSDPGHHFSLDTPPTAISSVAPSYPSYPYARNDVMDQIYTAPGLGQYPKVYLPGATSKIQQPYSRWQHQR